MIFSLQRIYKLFPIYFLFSWLIVQSLPSQYVDVDEIGVVATNETLTSVPVGYGYGNLGPYVVHGKIWVFYSDGIGAFWKTKSINSDNQWSERRFLFEETEGAYFNIAFDGIYFHFVRQINDMGGWGDLEYRRGKAEEDGSITFNDAEVIYSDVQWKVSNRHFSIISDYRNALWVMMKVYNVDTDSYKAIALSSVGNSGSWNERNGFPKNLNDESDSNINGRGPKIIEINKGMVLFSWRNHQTEDPGIVARLWIEDSINPDGEGTIGNLEFTQIPRSLAKSGETSIVSPANGIAMVNSGRTIARRNIDGRWQRIDPPEEIIEDVNTRSNSLSVNNGNVRIWDVEGDNIRYSETDDFGDSWGSVVVRVTVQNPSYLSASHSEGSDGVFHAALWRFGENPYNIGISIDGSVRNPIKPPTAPLLVSPADGASGVPDSTELRWENLETADTYTIQIAKNSDMVNPVFNISGIIDTFVVASLEAETEYYWWARAVNEGVMSDWSPVRSFTTIIHVPASPFLVSPENNANNVSVDSVLKWEKLESADFYSIQISQNSKFSNPVVDIQEITGTEYQISLATETTYYWRVRAYNEGGMGEWSTVWSFRTAPAVPAIPQLVSPENGAENISIDTLLTWNNTARAEYYHIQVSTEIDFSMLIFNDNNVNTNSFDIYDLENLTTYYWRVRAVNGGGQSDWSTVRSFTTYDITGVEQIKSKVPTIFSLDQNYPNPFNPVTTVRFGIPVDVTIRLEIYNILGQYVTTLIDGVHHTAGFYEANWDARDVSGRIVPSGIYIYRIMAGDYVETKKMTLMK